MREIIHTDYDGRPCPCPAYGDDCTLGNLGAPIVRSGGEPFKSYYAVEWGYYCHSEIDPSRSFVETMVKAMDEQCSESNNWPACDAILVLLGDLGFDLDHLTRADIVAFWTMFPKGLSEFLALPYLRFQNFNNPHGDVVRVLNNPGFYKEANAPERRLVEIATVGGFRFALDRASHIAPAPVLAKELAMLNYGCNEPDKVDAIADGLTTEIAEVLDDWGLVPKADGDLDENERDIV